MISLPGLEFICMKHRHLDKIRANYILKEFIVFMV